jgi:single-strand DNA-binding protein
MTDINHVVLIGRLVRDVDLKYTASGQPVCKFSIAVNRSKKNGDQWVDEANFFDVTLWGKLGVSLSTYMIKGKQIAVEGELRQDRWEQDGQNRSKVEIIANHVQLLGGSGQSGSVQAPAAASSPGKVNNGYAGGGGSQPDLSDDGFTDDIPF